MDIGVSNIFLPTWSWEQLLKAPLYSPKGLWSPRAQRQAEDKATPLPFLALLFLAVPTWKSTWSSQAFAELQLGPAVLSKERIPSILIKQNRIKECFSSTLYRTEVSGRTKSNTRKEGQSCGHNTQMNSGNYTLSAHSVKISLLAPDKSLSPCLCFPCVKGWQCLLCLFWKFKT